jgi:hypothetical protein
LKRASTKTKFDEYNREVTASRVRVHQKVNGYCDAGTHINLFFGGSEFGSYSKFRQSTRWMSENAMAARARGDNQSALNWSLHAMRLGRTMRTRSSTLISSMVGGAIGAISSRH